MYIGKDSVKLTILIETGENISGATDIVLHVKKPSGEDVTWSGAAVYGSSKLRYQTANGDLDEVGWYKIYPTLTLGTFQGTGKPDKFLVQDPSDPARLYNR